MKKVIISIYQGNIEIFAPNGITVEIRDYDRNPETPPITEQEIHKAQDYANFDVEQCRLPENINTSTLVFVDHVYGESAMRLCVGQAFYTDTPLYWIKALDPMGLNGYILFHLKGESV